MKKIALLLTVLIFVVSTFSNGVRAAAPLTICAPQVALFNQDPYPANPGEYVKVVFQVTGLENPDCKKVTFSIQDTFPFALGSNDAKEVNLFGGSYVRNYNSTALIPYKLFVNKDAVDGDNEIETMLQFERADGSIVSQVEQFNINVEGVKVDFEVSVKDFDALTNTLTFEILNTGESDVEALAVDIPKQDTISVKGSNRNIIGSLDANDDTTFKFEAVPKDGEIGLSISYTDSINERRHLMKKVDYDSSYFTGRKSEAVQPKSIYYYLFYGLLVLVILGFVRGWWKRRKKKERDRNNKK